MAVLTLYQASVWPETARPVSAGGAGRSFAGRLSGPVETTIRPRPATRSDQRLLYEMTPSICTVNEPSPRSTTPTSKPPPEANVNRPVPPSVNVK